MSIIRGCRDIMGTFIFSGVLKNAGRDFGWCALKPNAGSVPDFMYRMDARGSATATG